MTERGRLFWLLRDERVVADGAKFPDGTAVIRWRATDRLKPTTAVHDDLGSIVAVHGRGGAIRAQWCDTVPMVVEKEHEEIGFA